MIKLKNSSGDFVKVQEGESCNIRGEVKDTSGALVTTPTSITCTLFDLETGVVINGRKDQSILNVNGGSYSNGSYILELDAADNAIVGNLDEGKSQTHVVRIEIEYNDGDSDRVAIEEFSFPVERLRETVGVGVGANEVVINISDSSGSGVSDVSVYVSTDSEGGDVIAGRVLTDNQGNTPSLYLDAGVYYRFAERDGYSFTNPIKFDVS
jgi:hypothetical protein